MEQNSSDDQDNKNVKNETFKNKKGYDRSALYLFEIIGLRFFKNPLKTSYYILEKKVVPLLVASAIVAYWRTLSAGEVI